MNLHRLGRAVAFLAGSIVGGLALAFVIVFLHPQLLQRAAARAGTRTGAAAPAPQRQAAAPMPGSHSRAGCSRQSATDRRR